MILRPPPFRMPNAVCLYVRVRVCVRVHKCAHNLRPPEDRLWLLFALSGCQAAAQVLRLTMENGSPMRIKFGVSCCAATPAEPARPLRRCDVNFFCATGSLFSYGFRCATKRQCDASATVLSSPTTSETMLHALLLLLLQPLAEHSCWGLLSVSVSTENQGKCNK